MFDNCLLLTVPFENIESISLVFSPEVDHLLEDPAPAGDQVVTDRSSPQPLPKQSEASANSSSCSSGGGGDTSADSAFDSLLLTSSASKRQPATSTPAAPIFYQADCFKAHNRIWASCSAQTAQKRFKCR